MKSRHDPVLVLIILVLTMSLILQWGITDGAAEEPHGASALVTAAGNGNLETVKSLLKKGVDVNFKAEDGSTALMRAASNGDVEMTRFLLSKGADVSAEADDGSTAIMWAAAAGQAEIVTILCEKGAAMTLHIAAALGDISGVRYFRDAGVGLDSRAKDGKTALMLAAEHGHVDAMKLLLEKGAEVNARHTQNRSALTLAVRNGHTDAVKLLLKHGAYTEEKTGPLTILELAKRRGHTEIAKLLKKHGVRGRETLRGKVVASSPKTLTIRIPSEDPPEVLAIKVGSTTEFGPFRRPVVGEEVVAECREEDGIRFCYAVTAIPPAAVRRVGFGKMETFRGEVAASSPTSLTLKPPGGAGSERVLIRVGLKTKFAPFRRPSVGEEVVVDCRAGGGPRVGYAVQIIPPGESHVVKLGKIERFRGKVLALSPEELTIEVPAEGEIEVIEMSMSLRTKFVPFRRPSVGERVEVEVDTQAEQGKRVCYAVRVIPPDATQ